MKAFILLFFILMAIAQGLSTSNIASETDSSSPTGYPVTLYGKKVLTIYAPLGVFSAQQRAEQITNTLNEISKKNDFDPSHLIVMCKSSDCLIRYGTTSIMAVTADDANYSHKDLREFSDQTVTLLQDRLQNEHASHKIEYIFRQVGIVAGMLVALVVFLFLLEKIFSYLYKRVGSSSLFKTLTFRKFEIIHGETLRSLTITITKFTRISLGLLSIYYFMVTSFTLLPWTQEFDAKPLLQKVMWAIFSTLIALFLIRSSSILHITLLRKLMELKKTFFKPIELGGLIIISVQKEMELLTLMAKVVMFTFVIFVAYSYITFLFSLFDFTKTWADTLITYVMTPIKVIISAIIAFIPNIFYIFIIVYVFRYLLKMVHYFFSEIDNGNLKFEGFYHELALPTYGVIRVMIIIFAAIVIFPYLPGSNSPFFQGISIFMGLLLSMGSSSAIANIVAGIVLIYMRPFKIGDRVKIADTIGDVVEKNFLVTRIRTIKNADITIPNSLVLGGHIINYSSSTKDAGLILNTTVTIGYDVPWKDVHALLINAAKVTDDILQQPAPFVLQTSLDDFYVSYELNAYTDKPGKMARTYSDLHSAIQDRFNEAGVEIMSPHYGTLRDGNETTIPASYRPQGYTPPPFGVQLKN